MKNFGVTDIGIFGSSVYIIRVVQDKSADQRVVQDSYSDNSAHPRVVQYSADQRVVQF